MNQDMSTDTNPDDDNINPATDGLDTAPTGPVRHSNVLTWMTTDIDSTSLVSLGRGNAAIRLT